MYLPYIVGPFFRPKFQGISPENMAKHMVRKSYLHVLDPGEFPSIRLDFLPPGNRETGHRVAYDREVPFELRVQAESHL